MGLHFKNFTGSLRRRCTLIARLGCFNRDDPGPMVSDFPKQVDLSRAETKKMEYLTKKTGRDRNAFIVLFELCQKLKGTFLTADVDGTSTNETHFYEKSADENEDADFDLFEALVNCVEDVPAGDHGEEVRIHLTERSSQAEDFNRACLETDNQQSVVRQAQAEAYYRFMGIPLESIP